MLLDSGVGGVAGVVLGCSEHEEDLPTAGVL